MLLTFIAGLGALIVPTIATVIGLPAAWLLAYMANVAHYLSQLPWAVSKIELSLIAVTLSYAALTLLCIYLWHSTKLDLKDTNIIV